MRVIRWPMRARAATALAWLALIAGADRPLAAEDPPRTPVRIELSTQPPADAIRPFPTTEPTTFSVRVLDGAGAAVRDARVHVTLKSPPRGALFSTGFPIFEATTSFAFEAPAHEGVAEFTSFLPIRGDYALTVKASPPERDAARLEYKTQVFTVGVNENSAQVRNAAILLAGLFALGAVAGWFFARTQGLLRLAETTAPSGGR
ncbi:MAG: hypothetical protein HYZ53_11280 [Planctomycetes bacterium]|nr:hypothetical protein [Planctomycetota bacterium]